MLATIKLSVKRVLQRLIYGSIYDPKRYWTLHGLVYKKQQKTLLKRLSKTSKDDRNISLILETLRNHSFSSFLDVGCGYGLYLKYVANEFPLERIHGCDISPTQLRQARRFLGPNSKVVLKETDGQHLPYPDKSFDITFTYGVCIHVPNDKIENFIREIVRVTRKHYLFIESSIGKDSFSYFSHNYPEIFQTIGIKLQIVKEMNPNSKARLYITDV